VEWGVEFTDEFEDWWDGLSEAEQEDVAAYVTLIEKKGPTLPFPYSSDIRGSKHTHMRELRVQHKGRPYRVFYAFDPRRVAILLIGGDKTGDDRWYDTQVSFADEIYSRHLAALDNEGLKNG
jgi:hypothetical protein